MHVDHFCSGADGLSGAEQQLAILGLIREERHLALDVADDQVDPTIAVPVRQSDGARESSAHRQATREAQLLPARVLPLADPPEKVDVAR
jgi:hypothetical protein